MIPNVARRGTSFKGAGLYYLHDKREKGETTRLTSKRVPWTTTRNLMTENPYSAIKLMSWTAREKDNLKKSAGVKLTGNKSKGDVYAYSLAWHPEETGKYSRQDMLEAVDETLVVLGAKDHQALIVPHQDEPHPHVHVIVNMVHPHTGKNLKVSNDYKKLDKWAFEYRKKRGEEYLYCPTRTQKHAAIQRSKHGFEVDFIRPHKPLPDALLRDFKEVENNISDIEYQKFIANYRQQDKQEQYLQKYSEMKVRHKLEWEKLTEKKALRIYLNSQYKKHLEVMGGDVYKLVRPIFSKLLADSYSAKSNIDFERTSLKSALNIEFESYHELEEMGKTRPNLLSLLFSSYVGYKESRSNKNKYDKEISRLKKIYKSYIAKEKKKLVQRKGAAQKSYYHRYLKDRDLLIAAQEAEKRQFLDEFQSFYQQQKHRANATVFISELILEQKKRLGLGDALPDVSISQEHKKAVTGDTDKSKSRRKRKPRTRKRTRDE